ncbi:MAG TPA: hypothetical protein VM686_18890 [Polyangiaceae bacterium]|nr:hypothetical protein [Polyangiaceae bacterium]
MSSDPTQTSADESQTDRDLTDLPEPRRPWRRLTFAVMALCAACALALSVNLVPELVFALGDRNPVELGALEQLKPGRDHHNRLVHAEGSLSVDRALRLRRPLESDSYRLAQVEKNPNLWVQVRVPENEEGPHFVPPSSFVGRLISVSDVSVRQQGLREAIDGAGLGPMGDDAWILIDGEAPTGLRWVLGIVALLLAFAAFNVVGILRLARPIRSRVARG